MVRICPIPKKTAFFPVANLDMLFSIGDPTIKVLDLVTLSPFEKNTILKADNRSFELMPAIGFVTSILNGKAYVREMGKLKGFTSYNFDLKFPIIYAGIDGGLTQVRPSENIQQVGQAFDNQDLLISLSPLEIAVAPDIGRLVTNTIIVAGTVINLPLNMKYRPFPEQPGKYMQLNVSGEIWQPVSENNKKDGRYIEKSETSIITLFEIPKDSILTFSVYN